MIVIRLNPRYKLVVRIHGTTAALQLSAAAARVKSPEIYVSRLEIFILLTGYLFGIIWKFANRFKDEKKNKTVFSVILCYSSLGKTRHPITMSGKFDRRELRSCSYSFRDSYL